MKTLPTDLLTAGAIAKKLSVPDTKVKKALADLKIKPQAKKGVCSYYSQDAVSKIRSVLK